LGVGIMVCCFPLQKMPNSHFATHVGCDRSWLKMFSLYNLAARDFSNHSTDSSIVTRKGQY
jgi:hypothetical protein